MNEQAVAMKRDPIQETLARLASMDHGDVPTELVADAWRDALIPQLEFRVGTRMCAGLTDAQLHDFESLIDVGDEAGTTRWLDDHVPEYPRIVAEELDRLIADAVAWFARAAGGAR